jgi:D-aminopeptidase
VGGYVGHSSGEFVIAFSIRHRSTTQPARDDDGLDAPFHAAIDATEEAILNSIFCATTVTGVNGMTVRELPIDAVMMLLRGREGSHE